MRKWGLVFWIVVVLNEHLKLG